MCCSVLRLIIIINFSISNNLWWFHYSSLNPQRHGALTTKCCNVHDQLQEYYSLYFSVWDQSRSIWSTSFEQALIKQSIRNAQLYIRIVQHLSDKTNHNESFRERPRYFKDASYLARGFVCTRKDWLPYIKNNSC